MSDRRPYSSLGNNDLVRALVRKTGSTHHAADLLGLTYEQINAILGDAVPADEAVAEAARRSLRSGEPNKS